MLAETPSRILLPLATLENDMTKPWYLIADVGGTNARFASFHGDALEKLVVYDTKNGGDLLTMAHQFSEAMPERPSITVVAAAGPVRDNTVELTNAKQRIEGGALKEATGSAEARVINDFTAAAWSTHPVSADDLIVLSGSPFPAPGTHLVVGPGTGLGVGALIYDDGRFHNAPGEGGHIGIGPRSREEMEAFEALRTLWPEIFYGESLIIEAEGILSGTGLPLLYQASQIVEGAEVAPLDSRQIFERARTGSDTAAVRTIDMFKCHLAQAAGDLGLAFGATGGVFLVGGVALKNPWLFDQNFVDYFHQGGRFTRVREKLNLYILNRDDFGLLGAHNFAKDLAGQS